MQTNRLQNIAASFAIFSELSHAFCCVLPSVFTLATVLVGMGAIGAVPLWMDGLHNVMHVWEVPVIIASGLILVAGWAIHLYSKRLDCLSTGCGHAPCGSKKRHNGKILKIATVLFVVNVSIYSFAHVPTGAENSIESSAHAHDDHHHDHHH